MNEIRYFLFWLTPVILHNIIFSMMVEYTEPGASKLLIDHGASGILQTIVMIAFALFFSAFILAIGMEFAKSIGARLLLLQGNYNLKEDIIKPAFITGILVSTLLITLNIFMPLSDVLYSFTEIQSIQQFFFRLANNLLSVVGHSISVLLFWLAGIALVIKKVFKNISRDFAMYASIILICVCWHIGALVWVFGIKPLTIDVIVQSGLSIVLGMLFWKKGFETAVLCHMIIIFILSLVTPFVSLITR